MIVSDFCPTFATKQACAQDGSRCEGGLNRNDTIINNI